MKWRAHSKIPRNFVLRSGLDFINSFSYMLAGMPTFISTIFPHDDGEGADNLLGHWSRHGSTVGGSVGVLPQVVDDFLCGTCMCVCVCRSASCL